MNCKCMHCDKEFENKLHIKTSICKNCSFEFKSHRFQMEKFGWTFEKVKFKHSKNPIRTYFKDGYEINENLINEIQKGLVREKLK